VIIQKKSLVKGVIGMCLKMVHNVLAVGVRCRLWNTKLSLKNKFDMENNTLTNHKNGNDANRLLCAVYIVLDCEAPPKDVIWSVNSTIEKAIESEKQLNEMRVGGALTKIVEECVD